MIDIEKIYYCDRQENMRNLISGNGWSLVLSKVKEETGTYIPSIALIHKKKLPNHIKENTFNKTIIADLRICCEGIDTLDNYFELAINPEIEVLIHLLFTRFELGDKTYAIDVAVEMIKRKSLQKNANYLKRYFEIFNLICFIRKNIYGNVTVDSLAKHMLMSQSTLRRFCIQKLEKTASELIRDIKIAEAKNLLEVTDEEIRIIAMKLNYFNARTFSISFQQQTGYTPEEYRDCYQKKIMIDRKEEY